MKFSCSRPELYEIVSNVSRAVSGKTSLAVLEGILIRAKSGVLSFLGYDLDLGISAQMDAQVEEEGEIVLSAKLFVDMMRRMNGDTVTIHTDEKYLTEIKSGATEFTILGIPSDESLKFLWCRKEQFDQPAAASFEEHDLTKLYLPFPRTIPNRFILDPFPAGRRGTSGSIGRWIPTGFTQGKSFRRRISPVYHPWKDSIGNE